MDERPLALSALGNLRKKFRLGRVKRPGESGGEGDKSAIKEAIASALSDVQSAMDSDVHVDDALEAADEGEIPGKPEPKETVISSFTIGGSKKPSMASSGPDTTPAKRPRGRPRKVK